MNAPVPVRGRHLVTTRRSLWQRVSAFVFEPVLARIDSGLAAGTIETMLPDGSFRILGGRAPGPLAHIEFVRWRALWRIARAGSVGFYKGLAEGSWTSPDPVPIFDLVMRNRNSLAKTLRTTGVSRLIRRLRHAMRRNNRAGAKRNILAHYDLGNDFYRQWLDPTMSYSSALFAEPLNGEEALETAQRRKVSALLDRLHLDPRSHILEIGCGWGHVAKTCAEQGHDVTAITLSPSQKLWAERTTRDMLNQPDFRLCDYRDVTGIYDAVISVEMVEAVGQAYWPDYLDTIARSLKPGGRAAIQYIAIADDVFESYANGVDFIQTYIFPGGMLLSESRFQALAEARGLRWQEPHHFAGHYAETLRRWLVRFDDAVENGLLPGGFDARFVNLWRFYLQYCEGGFRGGGITVAQVTLVKDAVHD
jgi:cyclopropane-fatty-acyl-phospholipid synthase